jgi:hypothetical protein
MSICVEKQPCLAADTLCGMVMNKSRGKIIGSEIGVIASEVPLNQNLKKIPLKISHLGCDIV